MISQTTFLVGIDLGTSNCAVAYVEPAQGPRRRWWTFRCRSLKGPGRRGPGLCSRRVFACPVRTKMAPEATRLPWGEEPEVIVGEFARWRGARVPGRLVASAKSWLCHAGVESVRPDIALGCAAGGEEGVARRGLGAAAAAYRPAWDMAHPDGVLAEQEVIVTVPASFDEVARALTVSAAKQAGLERFTLVEEPQAAFYDFTARHRMTLARP